MSEDQEKKPTQADQPERPEKAPKPPKAGKPEKAEKAKKGDKPQEPEVIPVPRLQEKYYKEILPGLKEKLGRANRMSIPRLEKIVVNMGVGKAIADKKYMEEALEALKQITGQKPVVTNSRQSIANFKLREGMAIGCKVTLRGKRMFEFLDRLVSIALPRVRDFRGLSPKAFDGRGNYNLGVTEMMIFPELNPDKFTFTQGMNVTIVTSAKTDDEARILLKEFGMPLRAA